MTTLTFLLLAGAAANPLITDSKASFDSIQDLILRSAAKMPEEHYGFRPSPDVRSFGQVLGHIADAQYLLCGIEKGEKRALDVEKTKSSKADLTQALKDAFAYCDASHSSMTDANATGIVKFFGRDRARLSVLNVNIAHSNEHYGNLVTYMRMKGLVPPSSEAPPAAKKSR